MIKVLLVTGGAHSPLGSLTRVDSTEILETTAGSWRTLTTAKLPSPRDELRAGTVNNIVFIFGKNCLNSFLISIHFIRSYYFLLGGDNGSYQGLNSILLFNQTEESWQPAGKMTEPRYGHAVEVIEGVSQLCP